MRQDIKELLDKSYERYQKTGNRESFINYETMSIKEKQKYLDFLDELEERGYIEVVANALGFTQFKLTTYAIDELEAPDIQEASPATPLTQITIGEIHGPAIVGSQGKATINYSADLESIKNIVSTLPIDCKDTASELLKELETIEKSDEPIEKGKLSKFSDFLSKHDDLLAAVISLVGKIVVMP